MRKQRIPGGRSLQTTWPVLFPNVTVMEHEDRIQVKEICGTGEWDALSDLGFSLDIQDTIIGQLAKYKQAHRPGNRTVLLLK